LAPEGELLSLAHLAEVTAKRRAESAENNPEYTLASKHKVFSVLKYVFMYRGMDQRS